MAQKKRLKSSITYKILFSGINSLVLWTIRIIQTIASLYVTSLMISVLLCAAGAC